MITMLLDWYQAGVATPKINIFQRILNISCRNSVVGVSTDDF